MIEAYKFVNIAESSYYDGKKYKSMDCQGYVEDVLYRSGQENPKRNWRGSNHMWRNALSWRGTIAECKAEFGCIPEGAWMFIIKNDGGEKARGYYDNLGNASHVGIMCSNNRIRHSTKTPKVDGVTYADTGWTHVGLCADIDYHLSPYKPTAESDLIEEKLLESIALSQSALIDYQMMKGLLK